MNKMAKVMSKENINMKQSKQIIKAISKELLKVLSNDNIGKHSASSLHKTHSKGKLTTSAQKLKRSLSNINLKQSSCKKVSSREKDIGLKNELNSKKKDSAATKDMQNYLISHVLFDGNENIQSDKKSNLKLAKVNEDCAVNDENENDEAKIVIPVENECEKEDRMFEAYKQEMEKYLSCFEGNKEVKKKKKSKDKTR